jgi:2-oxoglutarate dehydrogenase E2 component (dihydrolipoamide succinyltransferase)
MAIEVRIPSVGESITEGRIVRWLKKDGDAVTTDEPLFELETDKATAEVPSPATGTLKIVSPEGSTVAVGSVVANIQEAAEARTKPSPKPPEDQARRVEPPAESSAGAKKDGERVAVGNEGKPREAASQPSPGLSPAARRLARENQIDVSTIPGSGRGGRVTKEDLTTYLEGRKGQDLGAPAPARAETAIESTTDKERFSPPVPSVGRLDKPSAPTRVNRETREPMSPIRRRIADRLLASQKSTATLTTFNEADLSAIGALRQQYKESFREKHGVGLGFLSFFVKACVEALKAFPVVNGRIDGEEIVYHHYYNIGVAVSTEKGLMVPVIHDADALSLAAIEHEISELSRKAREGKIAVSDLQGGTFTITNGGVFGSLLSTPILNPPQSAILGMHAIQKRPVAVDDQVVIRPMMYLALSYDHRLIDGRDAVLFLVRVKECIESPERLLLEL